jgi:N-acetylglucosaminyldiphosphoundecaprenol N-acetyl-beta-D-mannosaminyltransferase
MSVAAQRFDVLGVRVDAITMDEAVTALEHLVQRRGKGYFVFCTVSSILSARENPSVARAIADATVVTPDGMPLVWLGKRSVDGQVERVYGPDFLRAVFERRTGLRHFLYGGAPGVAERVEAALARDYPGSVVVGSFSPPMNLEAGRMDADGAAAIHAARPDVVWVGLGHPKQELWMHTMSDHLDVPVLAGVGAAFDFVSGAKKEAPAWMKRSGLQWLHRLASEPRRLWRRYVLGNLKFLWLLARERRRR